LNANRKTLAVVMAAIIACSMIVQGSGNQTRLEVSRSLSLRSETILDEHTEPLLSSSGQLGFVSSTTSGSLIAFSTATGKVLSSVVVGEGAGRCSMIEKGPLRLIAVPCANAPNSSRPATVSIIDASNPRRLDPVTLVVLPPDAHIVSSARPLLTSDGRFVLVASYFEEPTLFSFDARTGQMVSQLQLIGRPSSLTLMERTLASPGGLIAITSPVTNTVSVVDIDAQGKLGQQASFSPSGEGLDEDNNAAFSTDGQLLYVASSKTQQLLAIDASSGRQVGSIHVEPSPTRVTVASAAGGDLIAVTRVPGRRSGAPGGVTIIDASGGHLKVQSEFTPPDPIQFSTSNNAALTADGLVSFVGSKSGVLFAFSTTTGELESSQTLGNELMGLSLNDGDQMIATVRRTPKSDQIVILNFDNGDPEEVKAFGKGTEKAAEKVSAKPAPVPVINSLSPSTVEHGQLSKLAITVRGSNFASGSSLLINGSTMVSTQVINSKVVIGKLPPQLLAQAGTVNIQVQAPDGSQSQPVPLTVTTTQTPQISDLFPDQVPGPHPPFELRVNGGNFRETSVIVVSGQSLNTTFVKATQLRAEIPLALSKQVAQLSVQVVDAATPSLASNTVTLTLTGPVINQVIPSRSSIIAGSGRFTMVIKGSNFRDDAHVQINGNKLESSQVRVVSRGIIKTSVPPGFIDSAGPLPVVVVNGDGSASNAVNIDALAPEIQSLDPVHLVAGGTGSRVAISGANFRPRLVVKVGQAGGPLTHVPQQSVHFISGSRIVVILNSSIVSQPGSLSFQVVNPSKSGGVPSATTDLQLLGPNITDAKLAASNGNKEDVTLMISGSSFVAGARVQFLKDDQIELERAPDKVKRDTIILEIRSSKLAALGDYNVRVVNPGEIPSNQIQPHN
jgi:outer membrane protein assembly factor BamB